MSESIFEQLHGEVVSHAYQLQTYDHLVAALEEHRAPQVIVVTTLNGVSYALRNQHGQILITQEGDDRGWKKTTLHHPEPGEGLNTDVYVTSPIVMWAIH